ncbi:MAG TPA: coenzyme F420-0:L-glutamate ligase [Steroidobacter sp.]|uniref:coenzyme F420-0:L-glutamate ligase n=1 Tax=Steroidobacter sp. TaxID=1978227 RepID=UPI002ED88912
MSATISYVAIEGIGEIRPRADLAAEIARGLERIGFVPQPGDALVIAQKVVSKAEGRFVDLRSVTPSARAEELARITGKDARFIETVLTETEEVVRAAPNVLIVRHRLGFVAANAGIDRSNIEAVDGCELALLLPRDPDASASSLREQISARFGGPVGVIISDSFGRPWRYGVVNVALGVSGLPAVIDRRGETDRHGRTLEMTEVAYADAIAAGAALAMGEGAEGTPVVLVRGLHWTAPHSNGQRLIRAKREDLFR